MASQINYQQLSDELDDILTTLQDKELDIDQATKLYERGNEIAKKLEQYLKTAENKISKIKDAK